MTLNCGLKLSISGFNVSNTIIWIKDLCTNYVNNFSTSFYGIHFSCIFTSPFDPDLTAQEFHDALALCHQKPLLNVPSNCNSYAKWSNTCTHYDLHYCMFHFLMFCWHFSKLLGNVLLGMQTILSCLTYILLLKCSSSVFGKCLGRLLHYTIIISFQKWALSRCDCGSHISTIIIKLVHVCFAWCIHP